jgi:taurine transport system substrate-binding protein
MQGLTTRRGALAGAMGMAALGLAGRARAAKPATVNVGFFTETKPTMIGKGLGWFEEGVKSKISWTEMASGAQINTAIVAGSLDFGLATGSVPTAAAIAQQLPLKLIGMVDNIGAAEELVVRKSAGLAKPPDFKGHKLATPFGSTSHFRLMGFLKTNGLSQRDVTVLDMSAPAIVAAWSRGEIDGAYIWAPAKSKLLADGGMIYNTASTLEKQGYVIADLIVVRSGFAQSDPDAVVGFLSAYGKALDMWKTKAVDAAAVVAKQAGVTPDVAMADLKEYDFISLKEQLSPRWLGGPGKAGDFAGTLKSTADFLVGQRSIRSAPKLEAFQKAIDTSYLAKAVA